MPKRDSHLQQSGSRSLRTVKIRRRCKFPVGRSDLRRQTSLRAIFVDLSGSPVLPLSYVKRLTSVLRRSPYQVFCQTSIRLTD